MKTGLSDVNSPTEANRHFERMFHSLQFNFIENFMHWLPFSNLWLLTIGSQGEAKCYTKEFNGSQEAKGLWSLNNIRTKTRLLNVNL